MEPECLEPLNLVMKKKNVSDECKIVDYSVDPASGPKYKFKKTTIIESKSKTTDNMTILLQESINSSESEILPTDPKFLTSLYMSSLMQMSSSPTIRSHLLSGPYNAQQNFMQLLTMIEARHRMWQQLNLPLPQNLLQYANITTAAPTVGLSQPFFDGSLTNVNEQVCGSSNSFLSYLSPSAKSTQLRYDNKEKFIHWY